MFVLNLLFFNSFSLIPSDSFKNKQGALNRNINDTVENQEQDKYKKIGQNIRTLKENSGHSSLWLVQLETKIGAKN